MPICFANLIFIGFASNMYFCKDEIHISQIDITQVNQYENDFHLMETTFLTH